MTKFFTKIAAVALTASLILTGTVASAKGPGGGGGGGGGGSFGGNASHSQPTFQSNNFNSNKITSSAPVMKTGNTGIVGSQNLGVQNTFKSTNLNPTKLNPTNLNSTNLNPTNLKTATLPIINKPVTMTSNDLKPKGIDSVIHNNPLNQIKPQHEMLKDKFCKDEPHDKCKLPCQDHCHDKCWWNIGCNSSWFGCYSAPTCSDPWWYTCSPPVTEVIVEQPVVLDVTVVQPTVIQPVAGQTVVDPNAAQPVDGGAMQQALQGLGDEQAPAADQTLAAE